MYKLNEQILRIRKMMELNEGSVGLSADKAKCIRDVLKQEISKYKGEDNYDDRLVEFRAELRNVESFIDNGYFTMDRVEHNSLMDYFLSGLDYSNNHTYKKGEEVGVLPKSSLIIYKAIGDRTLFRGVSLLDWERIQKAGLIDSDMRSAILDTEGINLGQIPMTASYYLPHGTDGVILAISPKNLDLYMLRDEYIRVFEPIPLKNVIKVSDVFSKDSYGSIKTKDNNKKLTDILNKLKDMGLDITC